MRAISMTRNEYLLKLDDIDNLIKSNPEKALEELNSIFKVKPVTKKWFLLKAKALWAKNHNPVEVFSTLRGKILLRVGDKIDKNILQMQQNALHERNILDKERYNFLINSFPNVSSRDDEFYKLLEKRAAKAKENFLNNMLAGRYIEELASCYYIYNDLVLFTLLELLKDELNLTWCIGKREWINQGFNMGYLIEQVRNQKSSVFVVLETDENDSLDCQVIIKILNYLKKKVIMIKKPLLYTVKNDISLESTLAVSLDNVIKQENMLIFHPIVLKKNMGFHADNRGLLISHIVNNIVPEHFATILCSGNLFTKLETYLELKKSFQRLSVVSSEYLEKNITFGWSGDYLKYCDILYGVDTKSLLEAPDECEFSIIVPARNSVYYLRHTLMTCLNQRYEGKYEIILSDNSSNGNMEIYKLYKELDDPRIKYFRTPREFPLTRSFEFAFLQARGKFVFSVGSDDGVLPWALDIIEKVLKQNPELDLITWERGFYAWPGFNGKQQNQFNIPRAYIKENITLLSYHSKQTLTKVIENPQVSYLIPLMYINSGCRRRYLKNVLEKTGRLWDGVCQDLYMGVVNLAINETYTFLQYPLTIAGMSNNSMGVVSVLPQRENASALSDMEKRKKVDNIGAYAQSKLEYIVPPINFDCVSFYRSVVRMVVRGCLSIDFLEHLNWEKIYINIALNLSREDVVLEKKLDELRYSAKSISLEFYNFVEKEICQPFLEPVVFEKKVDDQKRGYTVGLLEGGGAILDASEFGVENIYDATLLFEKLTGL